MKYCLFAVTFVFLTITSCKTNEKKEVVQYEKEKNILEKVAQAHGYDNWNKVEEIKFTFNVDGDTSHFERTWIWRPKSNDVMSISAHDTLTYNRKDLDSITHKNHRGFINDKFWLLAPYQLVWDAKNITYEHLKNIKAPLSKKPMQKLTIVYGSDGGYTPGDAYDFYFEDNYLIKEWIFRKANRSEPSMTNTWEDYTDIEGLRIAQMHQNEQGNFKLYFTHLEVNTN